MSDTQQYPGLGDTFYVQTKAEAQAGSPGTIKAIYLSYAGQPIFDPNFKMNESGQLLDADGNVIKIFNSQGQEISSNPNGYMITPETSFSINRALQGRRMSPSQQLKIVFL